MYLLQVYKQTGNKKYLETAVKAGEYIEQFANPAKNGGTYYYLYDLVAANEGDEDTIHVNFPMARRERRICGQCFMRQPEIKSILEEQKKFLNILTE